MEFIICSAIKLNSGEIIYGHRHNHCFDVVRARVRDERPDFMKIVQGFVTSTGRFVDRKEAMTIQKAAGKLNTKGQPLDGQILFSEDLY